MEQYCGEIDPRVQYYMEQEQKIKLLNEAIARQDHNRVYEYAKALLKEDPSDIQIEQCLIISSLRIKEEKQLSSGVFRTPPKDATLIPLYAYYLYTNGNYSRSMQVSSNSKTFPHAKLLLAQSQFQVQDYSGSAQSMMALLNENKGEQRDNYLTNLLATGVNEVLTANLVRQLQADVRKSECPQVFFNYALVLLQLNDYSRSLEYIDRFAATYTPNPNDTISITLFRHYLNHLQQQQYAAADVKELQQMQSLLTDLNIRSVLKNNLMVMSQNQTHHQHFKVLEQCSMSQCKLTKLQHKGLLLNRIILLIKKNRLPEAFKILKQLESQYHDLMDNPQYLKCKFILLHKSKEGELKQFIKRVKQMNPMMGTLMQIEVCRENNSLTELLRDKMVDPIIKNYLFGLILQNPNLFEQYSDYLHDLSSSSEDVTALQALLNIYRSRNDSLTQEKVARRLLQLQPRSTEAKLSLASLLLNKGEYEEANEVVRGLDSPQQISDAVHLQFLEKNIHVSKKSEEVAVDKKKKKIKKRRKIRLPKGVTESVPGYKGDPERWLPKWQRKGYKKRGKKGVGKTQGLATVEKTETKNTYTNAATTSNKEATKDAPRRKK